jgi:TRAP-type uncharacterized transport system fused permease subunit
MKKTAIGPLVATMLLLSFAVAVAVVVMNFGRAEVELQSECPIDINMQLVGNNCYDTVQQGFNFAVENGLNIRVEGLIVSIIGETAETFDLDQAVVRLADTYSGRIGFSPGIRQVKITPRVLLRGEPQICPEKALILDNIVNC